MPGTAAGGAATGTAASYPPGPTETYPTEITRCTPYAQLPELLTPLELASYLGLSSWCVYKQLREGLIPHRRIGRKCVFIPKAFLHANQAQKTVTP